MTILGSGAEAVVTFASEVAVKTRIQKDYRLAVLDERLRAARTRREAKVLIRLRQNGFPCPDLIHCEGSELRMSFIAGRKLRDCIDKNPVDLGREVGARIAQIHEAGIIHGDLTTSNMLLNDHLYFVDFGLSFFSDKDEDRACDLHVLKQVLESTHHVISADVWNAVLSAYGNWTHANSVLKRLAVVEKRGRNKKISVN